MVWHYTIEKHASSILEERQINPAYENTPDGEIPITWFSLDPFFEQTAKKHVTAKKRLATWDEMVKAKLWRFGISPTKLVRWPELIQIANISPSEVCKLVQNGTERGAKPSDWFGVTRPVALNEIEAIEKFDGANWIPVKE